MKGDDLEDEAGIGYAKADDKDLVTKKMGGICPKEIMEIESHM